jgi:hypothetical protein
LPNLFIESHWSPELGVTHPESTQNQVNLALNCLANQAENQRVFMFMNISALHQPNCMYLNGATSDTYESHIAALAYVDSQLPPLFEAFQNRGKTVIQKS